MTAHITALSPLEVATGLVSGTARRPGRRPQTRQTPMDALESVIRATLQRPPCVVAFSGGRDSSAVLAVAARLARREGLEPPVPVTNRFPHLPSADETLWQERVVASLGLADWVRISHDDELDCLGPVARRALLAHGLLWPFNAHFLIPALRVARGGSALTGLGGDEIFGETRWARAATVLARRQRPTLRDARRIALALAPSWARRQVLDSRIDVDLSWLQPAARISVHRSWVHEGAEEPLRWDQRIHWSAARRYLDVGAANLAVLAGDEDVLIAHPLTDGDFVETLAAARPEARFFDRTEAMRALFGAVLPDDILSRVSKSSFDGAFFNRHARAFVAEWDGSGVDETIVNAEELARVWQSDTPDARTLLLLQSLWLAQQEDDVGSRTTGGVEEPVGALA